MYPSNRYVSLFPPSLQWVSWPPRHRGPAVPHLRRYYGVVRLLPTPPSALRSPLAAATSAVGCLPLLPPGAHPYPLGQVRLGRVNHTRSREEIGSSPRFLGNPFESVPRARDSDGPGTTSHNARPDTAFRQANNVGTVTMKRFRS
jgi:hypothetical protein